jgi:hypothetical protein
MTLPAAPALRLGVHQTDPAHAVEQTRLALANGADGVFLINHWGPCSDLVDSVAAVRSELGDDPWVGVNPLGLRSLAAARFLPVIAAGGRVDGLWCDDAEIDEATASTQFYARQVRQELQANSPGTAYFGGVAFKYQRRVDQLEAAAAAAAPWMDVICTSGPGTGHAADLEKLARLASAAGTTPLAVASGVSAANAADQIAHISFALAATSVSDTDTELNGPKVAELAAIFEEHRVLVPTD